MTEPINQSMHRNTSKSCNATGCYEPRRNLGGYCKKHYTNAYLYGDPNGKAILAKDYLGEIERVGELIDANLEHPAVEAACVYLQRWLDSASRGEAGMCAIAVARVASEASAVDVLKATSALWLYSENNPCRFSSDLNLTYQLGMSFLRCARYPTKISSLGKQYSIVPTGGTRRAIGQKLRDTLGLFYMNLCAHFRDLDEAEGQLKKDMYKSFN